jgi:hypothetical protein
MKTLLFTILILSVISISLPGCTHATKKATKTSKLIETTKILEQDKARVAITLNKGFGITVISTNDGKRIEPKCVTNKKAQQSYPSVPLCDEFNFDAAKPDSEKVLYKQTFQVSVKQGSVCVYVKIGSAYYKFCDPPYDLSGF